MMAALCSCGKQGRVSSGSLPDVSLFHCNAYTTIREVMYSFYWERMSDSSFRFRFLGPTSLEGYQMQCVGEDVTVTYNGMELQNPQALTQDSFLYHLAAAVQALSGGQNFTGRPKGKTVEYTDGQEQYVLTFGKQDGLLHSLPLNPLNLTVEITDFERTNQ